MTSALVANLSEIASNTRGVPTLTYHKFQDDQW